MRDSSSSRCGRLGCGTEERSGRGDVFRNRNMTDLQKTRAGNLTVLPDGREESSRPGTVPLSDNVTRRPPRATGQCSPTIDRTAGRSQHSRGVPREPGEFFLDNNDPTDEEGCKPSIKLPKKDNFSRFIHC